mmetsp:Transcript_104/g.248  ORF Transcript_104/g.248 Transcript_104/m.248 type:complete len:150 (+) Transcript_104:26-475(+)
MGVCPCTGPPTRGKPHVKSGASREVPPTEDQVIQFWSDTFTRSSAQPSNILEASAPREMLPAIPHIAALHFWSGNDGQTNNSSGRGRDCSPEVRRRHHGRHRREVLATKGASACRPQPIADALLVEGVAAGCDLDSILSLPNAEADGTF